jgi:hypothetical protein
MTLAKTHWDSICKMVFNKSFWKYFCKRVQNYCCFRPTKCLLNATGARFNDEARRRMMMQRARRDFGEEMGWLAVKRRLQAACRRAMSGSGGAWAHALTAATFKCWARQRRAASAAPR